MGSYLFGLEHSNKDFCDEESFGKNTFTCAFPVSIALYMDSLDMPVNYIIAVDGFGYPETEQVLVPLEELLGVAPASAEYRFEDSFAGYDLYATGEAARSDLVVYDLQTGREVSAFEVKLVVVPTSGTADYVREDQCCELVVRPPSIEQLCFSIAASFGKERRQEIGDIIVDALKNPIDYEWNNESFMLRKRREMLQAADTLTRVGMESQSPFVLMGEWRTLGQTATLDNQCFDVFFWSNFAFLQLFVQAMRRDLNSDRINRPSRALIWFIKSMFDYAAQGAVTFERTHSLVTFGAQTDKAGSFTNEGIRPFVKSHNFVYPRIPAANYREIIKPEGIAMLKPERRLDGVLSALLTNVSNQQ